MRDHIKNRQWDRIIIESCDQAIFFQACEAHMLFYNDNRCDGMMEIKRKTSVPEFVRELLEAGYKLTEQRTETHEWVLDPVSVEVCVYERA